MASSATDPTDPQPPSTPEPPSARELLPPEMRVADAVGRLIEFWGFKRNMGRLWTLLYLSPTPLSAKDLQDLLQISAGAISMTLTELTRWGVVKKVWVQGERKDYFAAEVALWRMISRVFRERERVEVERSIESLEHALAEFERNKLEGSGESRSRADLQARRVKALLDFAKIGRTLLDALLSTAKLDAEPLTNFLLSSRE